MAVYIWSFIYLPLGNAFWITLFIPQTKFLCLYWLCNLKTKGVDAIFWYLVNQIQTFKNWVPLLNVCSRGILNGDMLAWFIWRTRFIMGYFDVLVILWILLSSLKKKCGQHVKTLICEDKIDLIFWQLQVLLQLLFQNKNNFGRYR